MSKMYFEYMILPWVKMNIHIFARLSKIDVFNSQNILWKMFIARDSLRKFEYVDLVKLTIFIRRSPAQDVPFDLIIWYIAKTIPNL